MHTQCQASHVWWYSSRLSSLTQQDTKCRCWSLPWSMYFVLNRLHPSSCSKIICWRLCQDLAVIAQFCHSWQFSQQSCSSVKVISLTVYSLVLHNSITSASMLGSCRECSHMFVKAEGVIALETSMTLLITQIYEVLILTSSGTTSLNFLFTHTCSHVCNSYRLMKDYSTVHF